MAQKRRTQRVHFSPDEDKGHGEGKDILNAIIQNDILHVHVGFLKINHHYRVSALITNDQLEICVRIGESTKNKRSPFFPNLRCKIVQLWPNEEGLILVAEIFAECEKVFEEDVFFHIPGRDEPLQLQFEGSVFGRYDGSPRLNSGVQCIGYEKDYESDTSMENSAADIKNC